MENKRKILFITPLPPPVHGSSMVSEYIKESALLNETFDMDFVNLSTSRTMEEIGKNSLSLYLKKMFRFLASYGLAIWKLLFNHYDLCYIAITCHGVGFLKDMPFVLLCKLFGRKVVLHQHNKGMSECVDCSPYKWLMPLVYKNTKVILLSERLYLDVSKVVKKEQVLICPNGIPPLNVVANKDKENPNLQLLYLSNLIVSKGVYVLLDACKILMDRGCSFVCDFVGGESKEITRQILEEAIKGRGLEDYVKYHGPQYGLHKEEYWEAADVFVFPTFYYNECFPLVLLEAMQHGVACISTDEAGIPDIIKDNVNGLLCEKENSEDLAEKIMKLINNPTLTKTMGSEGLRRYNKYFSLCEFENRMSECLLKAIND